MKYMNATQAASEIGISYRTMRRWIDADRIAVERGEDGQYSISASEVERLKQEQAERPIPARRGQNETGHTHVDFEQRIADLETRVRTLEDSASRDKTATEPLMTTNQYNQPTQKIETQNRIVEPSEEDTLSARDFAAKIGMEYTVLDGYTRRGVRGEKMDVTEVPHPTRKGYSNKYFTQEQQEKAIELLRKHKRLK